MNTVQLLEQADQLLKIVSRTFADAGRLGHQDAWWLFVAGAAAVVLSILLLRER